jgi:hypothetical protein
MYSLTQGNVFIYIHVIRTILLMIYSTLLFEHAKISLFFPLMIPYYFLLKMVIKIKENKNVHMCIMVHANNSAHSLRLISVNNYFESG